MVQCWPQGFCIMFNSRMPRISGLKWRALVILAGTRALLVCNKTWVKPKPEILHPNGDPQKWSFGLVIIKENPPADRDPKYPKTAADGSGHCGPWLLAPVLLLPFLHRPSALAGDFAWSIGRAMPIWVRQGWTCLNLLRPDEFLVAGWDI